MKKHRGHWLYSASMALWSGRRGLQWSSAGQRCSCPTIKHIDADVLAQQACCCLSALGSCTALQPAETTAARPASRRRELCCAGLTRPPCCAAPAHLLASTCPQILVWPTLTCDIKSAICGRLVSSISTYAQDQTAERGAGTWRTCPPLSRCIGQPKPVLAGLKEWNSI